MSKPAKIGRTKKDEYLGDDVYASFNGRQIWLDLRGQDDHTAIALEPAVMMALERYAEKVFGKREDQ